MPIGHRVNPNIAIVTGMSCHPDEEEAIRRGLDGFRFFGYSLGYYALFGEHRPGRTDLWQRFLQVKDQLAGQCRARRHRHPRQLRAHLARYEKAGIDQVMFVQQSGANRHEHICDSLEIFAAQVMPEFKERDRVRQTQKERANWRPISRRHWRASRGWRRLRTRISRVSKPLVARRRRRSSSDRGGAIRSRPQTRSPPIQLPQGGGGVWGGEGGGRGRWGRGGVAE